LFTTAKSLTEIQSEAEEVKRLFLKADALYKSQQEEQKFIKLRELLTSQNVIDGEKLVLFTEHKDTLLYLEERLKNNGYTVTTIHGGHIMPICPDTLYINLSKLHSLNN
jgi:superfamily II DNA/RNA helicase